MVVKPSSPLTDLATSRDLGDCCCSGPQYWARGKGWGRRRLAGGALFLALGRGLLLADLLDDPRPGGVHDGIDELIAALQPSTNAPVDQSSSHVVRNAHGLGLGVD